MLSLQIKALRHRNGWSQAELAGRLHVSSSAIGMYEQGRREPSVDTLIALAQVFGVSLDYLLSGQPDTVRDVSALHQMMKQEFTGNTEGHTKEEIMCHLLWALLE